MGDDGDAFGQFHHDDLTARRGNVALHTARVARSCTAGQIEGLVDLEQTARQEGIVLCD